MRRLLVAVALIGFVSNASAGDLEIPGFDGPAYGPTPVLPAPPAYVRWSGLYVGGNIGYSSAHIDFSQATQSLLAFELRTLALENEQHPSQWQVLKNVDTNGPSAGAFVGYNGQWDDIVIGVELNYGTSKFSATAPSDPIRRVVTTSDGNVYDATVSGSASVKIHDFGTARLRAGYVMGPFLPWAMVGFAAGRADYTRSATITGAQNPPTGWPLAPCDPLAGCVEFSFGASDAKNNAWLYGWATGAGVDVMIMPHVLVRAEYEYTSFASLAGIRPAINTVRLGAGFKF
jgi:opacity protein-like surface antigen